MPQLWAVIPAHKPACGRQVWTKMVKQNGLTNEEIVEAINVTRYMKQATVNDTVANSLNIIQGEK